MLWHKAWLETRWRFISALLILTVLAGGNVYDYLATQRLLPRLNVTTAAPADDILGVGQALRDAVETQKTFRGFIWYQAFRQNLTQMGVFFGIFLGCGGLLSESSKGSALFTLSLPVTRRQILGTRTATGLVQLAAIALIPPLAISILAPSIGQHFALGDAFAHGLCIFVVGAVFFSLASFLSTLYADIWKPLLISIGIACLAVMLAVAAPSWSIFRVMSGE